MEAKKEKTKEESTKSLKAKIDALTKERNRLITENNKLKELIRISIAQMNKLGLDFQIIGRNVEMEFARIINPQPQGIQPTPRVP